MEAIAFQCSSGGAGRRNVCEGGGREMCVIGIEKASEDG